VSTTKVRPKTAWKAGNSPSPIKGQTPKWPLGSGTTTGWWYTYPSEKYEFVSWDDEIPN